jgi:hypothetical protein
LVGFTIVRLSIHPRCRQKFRDWDWDWALKAYKSL